jgi:hypothetical protein
MCFPCRNISRFEIYLSLHTLDKTESHRSEVVALLLSGPSSELHILNERAPLSVRVLYFVNSDILIIIFKCFGEIGARMNVH